MSARKADRSVSLDEFKKNILKYWTLDTEFKNINNLLGVEPSANRGGEA